MDAFTKRFYERGNQNNEKTGSKTRYPIGGKKKEVAKKMKYTGKKGEYSKTQQGNFMKVHPLDREGSNNKRLNKAYKSEDNFSTRKGE